MNVKQNKNSNTSRALSRVEEGGLSTILSTQELGEVLQPLIREVHLFDTFVAGTSHVKDASVFSELEEGQLLLLEREQNKFDENAIQILTENKKKIGYIPEKDNVIFARLMDAGKLLRARVHSIQDIHGFLKISIGIILIDV